jgi:hypothetical protein
MMFSATIVRPIPAIARNAPHVEETESTEYFLISQPLRIGR